MSGRFSNTSAKPRSRARSPSSDPGSVITANRPRPLGPRPGPLEVAARLDRGAGLRRRDVQRGVGIALEADPRDGGRVGGVEHVEPRAARCRQQACGPAPRGRGWSRPSPSRARARCPSTSASHRLVRPGRSACTSAITGIQPRRSASSVGSSRQRVWSPAKQAGRRRPGRSGRARSVGGRRRRSRSRADPSTPRSTSRQSAARRDDLVDHVVRVGEAGEQHLVGARAPGRRRGRAWRGRTRA